MIMTLEEVKNEHSLLKDKRLYSHCLHYTAPSFGGWGIVRVGMLVPESVMLFIAPPACGRHGAIAGIQLGFKHRLFYLYIEEVDLVLGRHMDLVSEAVEDIMLSCAKKPGAFLLCITCVDHLLGSDYEPIVKQIETRYGIPARLCHMNPIVTEGKTPPQLNIQKSVYSFIPKAQKKDKGINIFGSYVPIHETSELYQVLENAGFREIRHIGNCNSINDLEKMGESAFNLLIRPEGMLAAKYMEENLNIPYCYVPVSYSLYSIDKNYKTIEKLLGVSLDTEAYKKGAISEIEALLNQLGTLSLAVSSGANAMPFELSRALTEFGFIVKYIFCDEIASSDLEHLNWLWEHSPDTKVLTNIYPGMTAFAQELNTVDMAIGFTAGYYCRCTKTVPLTLDIQPFGYNGILYLLESMKKAWEKPIDLEKLILESTVIV